jgi:YHS domain-containing protein
LVRISADVWIEDILDRIKNRDPELNEYEEEEENENPEEGKDAEEGEKEKKLKEWKTPLECEISDCVMNGTAPTEEQIDKILIDMIASPNARTKGFILDVDFSNLCEKTWTQRVTRAEMLPNNEEFTHIIELLIDDEEVIVRAADMLYSLEPKPADQEEELGPFHPDHGKVFSAWERKQRIKAPKAIEYDEDGEIIEPEEEEEDEGPKPFDESTMFVRVCEDKDRFLQELDYYSNIERPAMDDFIINCYDQTYIKIDIAGLTPDEVCETVKFRLKPDESAPLRPIGKVMEEPSGDYKSLLTDGIEPVNIGTEDDPRDFMPLPRQWSLWKQIDPVALSKGSVDKGEAGLAAEYANNVFTFKNEANRDAFAKSPKDFLKEAPQMPKDYRVLVVGPSCSGVKSQAEKLSEFYGWKVVDYPKIVRDKLAEINEMAEKLPNNISEEGPCMICLSQKELDDIRDHKPFPAAKFMPWILEFLGVPLALRPPPPPQAEPNLEEMTEDEQKAYMKK